MASGNSEPDIEWEYVPIPFEDTDDKKEIEVIHRKYEILKKQGKKSSLVVYHFHLILKKIQKETV